MKIIKFNRIGRTFGVYVFNEKKNAIDSYFIQLTFKEPFWYPHVEKMLPFNDGSWIAGWLFLYFGKIVGE